MIHNLEKMPHPAARISHTAVDRCKGIVMPPRVLEPSRAELEARRSHLLARLAMNRDDLERAADRGSLSGEQYWLHENIRSIEFLLGTEDDGR